MFYNIVKCFVNDSTTQICPSEVCIAAHDHKETFYDQACVTDDEVRGFRLQFITIVNADENKILRITDFQCGYNECNKKSILTQIRTVAEEDYDLEPMLTALHMLDESQKTTTKASSLLSLATISMAGSSKSTNTSTMTGSTKTTTTTETEAFPQSSMTSTTSMQSNIATTHAIGSASFVFGAFLLLSLF
jgi:hypothetical protein